MKIPGIKINSRVFCISLCISVFLCRSTAQQNIGALALPDYHKSNVLTPFFNKDETVGSTYLSRNWLRGTAELSSHKRIPEPDQPLLFNFDKIHNILYTIN